MIDDYTKWMYQNHSVFHELTDGLTEMLMRTGRLTVTELHLAVDLAAVLAEERKLAKVAERCGIDT